MQLTEATTLDRKSGEAERICGALGACDFFAPDKAVILSEALRRFIANRGLYGAQSKDPGDACWQMLLGAFRPQTTPEDKSVRRSASR